MTADATSPRVMARITGGKRPPITPGHRYHRPIASPEWLWFDRPRASIPSRIAHCASRRIDPCRITIPDPTLAFPTAIRA